LAGYVVFLAVGAGVGTVMGMTVLQSMLAGDEKGLESLERTV